MCCLRICLRQGHMYAGIIAFGVGRSGHHVRASGWGPAFLDMGSGYDIGESPEQVPCRSMGGLLSAGVRVWVGLMACSHSAVLHQTVSPAQSLRCQPTRCSTAYACSRRITLCDQCTGQRALAAVARAADGRGEGTDLVEATCRHCNVSKAEDLLEYGASHPSVPLSYMCHSVSIPRHHE